MSGRLSKRQALEMTPDEPTPDLTNATSFLPSKFKVPRKDASGNAAHINFYAATYYVRIAEEIRLKVKDFSTPSDVYACALHYGLKWLQEQDEIGLTSVQSQLMAWMRICQESELDEDIMLGMEKIRATINRKIDHGAKEEARRLIAMVRHETEQMPDGYYKERSLKFLEDEFGYLWDAKKLMPKPNGAGQVMDIKGEIIPAEAKEQG